MRIGIVVRVVLSAVVPTLLAVAAFTTLVVSTTQLRQAQAHAATSQTLVIAAGELSRAVGDVGVAARDVRLGVPAADAALDAAVRQVGRTADAITTLTDADDQRTGIPRLAAAARAYAAARGDGDTIAFGDALAGVLAAERDAVAADERIADAATQRAVVAAVTGLITSIVAVIGLGTYLTRAVTLPVRDAAAVAREFADGDLAVRLPVTGTGEIRDLQAALNDMAVALSAARTELVASRSRIAATTWRDRRELERNLHDGLQQRLVALNLDVRGLAADLHGAEPGLRAQADQISTSLSEATQELRDIARGIQPAVLTESGLPAALRTLARRSALPVEVTVDLPQRPSADVESAAYYFTAEAITNSIKHARATYVSVDARLTGGDLRVTVADDGVGGATSGAGSGLIGLRDRIEAAGGRMRVDSEPGQGTTLTAFLPPDGPPVST